MSHSPARASRPDSASGDYPQATPFRLRPTSPDVASDPLHEPTSRRFHQHPEQLAKAFSPAWFKLTHRDMGSFIHLLDMGATRKAFSENKEAFEGRERATGASKWTAIHVRIWRNARVYRGSRSRIR
jgi:catalase (peroxidase I)